MSRNGAPTHTPDDASAAGAPAGAPAIAFAAGARWPGVVLLLGAAVLWSASGVAVKWADIDPIAFSALRAVGAVVAMAPLLGLGARLTGRARPRPDLMLLNAALHTTMITSFICSMSWGTAAEGIFLQYSAPAWAALFAWLLLGRRVDRATLVALVVAMFGVALILGLNRAAPATSEAADGARRWLAPALGVVAGISYGGVILSLDAIDVDARRRLGATTNIFLIVLLANLASCLVLIPWALGRGMLQIAPAMMLAVVLFGMVQMATPYVLFQLGLRRIGPVAAGLIVLIEPILNPIWVWLAVGEQPPRSIYAGGALILAAVAITALFGRRRGVATPQAEADELALPAR